ncbi:hypothetical protein [Larkinella soli]|uniref:hypothetical protein n=1 Tax=Larkinella soli TaxID=1770527 RepID=UPI000FFC83E2|nr:hypothetical protein [Larkinella soli]
MALVCLATIIFIDSVAQPGINGGKPIITYNTSGPVSILTQSPPAFPGGEKVLVDFVLESAVDSDHPVKFKKKLWLTATVNSEGKVITLEPTYDHDPALKKEISRIGSRMPKWTPGMINKNGVETLYQFLVVR